MMKLRKILNLLLVLVFLMSSLTACQNDSTTSAKVDTEGKTASTKIVSAIETAQIKTDIQIAANINLLTGMPDLTKEAIGKRPVAIMINNIPKAFPQYGVEAADIIFEIPVEGQQTRFMALYGDYTQIPKICSVRSCRPYFPAFSEGFDAVYVNWGMMDEVRAYVKTLNLTHFEGLYNDGGLFSRDLERKAAGYSLEHTGVFDGTRVDDVLNETGRRTDIEEGKTDTAFAFAPINEIVTPTGDTCTKVDVDFGIALATLTYDEATNTYLKAYNGEKQIDGVTGNQLSFTNVLVLEAKIKGAENGIHRDVNWHGGNGYYVSNGAMQKITWSKASESDRIMLYDENGNELVLNRGKIYIAVNYIGEATFE
jgi:hypothetical protein